MKTNGRTNAIKITRKQITNYVQVEIHEKCKSMLREKMQFQEKKTVQIPRWLYSMPTTFNKGRNYKQLKLKVSTR